MNDGPTVGRRRPADRPPARDADSPPEIVADSPRGSDADRRPVARRPTELPRTLRQSTAVGGTERGRRVAQRSVVSGGPIPRAVLRAEYPAERPRPGGGFLPNRFGTPHDSNDTNRTTGGIDS